MEAEKQSPAGAGESVQAAGGRSALTSRILYPAPDTEKKIFVRW